MDRPRGRLRAVAGREREARQAADALAVLLRLVGEDAVRREVIRALVRAGVVEVERGVE